jgi:hypothetical protein
MMSDLPPSAAPLAAAPLQPTEPTTSAPPPAAPPPDKPEDEVVVFSEAQQKKLDEIIKKAMGRSAAETRKALQAEQERAAQLEAERDEALRATSKVSEENIALKKSVLIADMVMKHGFVDVHAVSAMVENSLKWSEPEKRWAIIGKDGSELPTTVPEFFSQFARAKPWLVRSDVRTGNASEHSTRSGLPGRPHHKIEELFGRGSNAAKANQLAQEDPQTYRTLKRAAIKQGLI